MLFNATQSKSVYRAINSPSGELYPFAGLPCCSDSSHLLCRNISSFQALADPVRYRTLDHKLMYSIPVPVR